MKKLLTLLGSVSLMTTTAQMAVACSPNYDQKDNDGNSILIQFLQSIDGKAQISSTDVLWRLINKNGPKNREQLTLDLLKMINLSILANAKDDPDLKEESIYANYNVKTILSDKWNSLNSAVNRQITSEKDKYKKDHGKKWEKEWNQMLVDKYSIYQDDVKSMDKEFLENKYKSNILLSDSNNNASKALLDVLIKTDQTGVTWISSIDVLKKYNALEKIVTANEKNDANIAKYLRADLDQIAQIKNATKSDAKQWVNTSLKSGDNDEKLAKVARDIFADGSEIKKENITNDTPVSINDFTVSDTNNSRAGFLSNSQRFFLDKFYTTQAPLAISEVTIPFSANGSFDSGVTPKDFHSDDGLDQKNNEDILKQISGSTGNDDWYRWMVTGSADKYEKVTVKHYDKLMTLSNSADFTNDMRAVVYDFILGDRSMGKKMNSNSIYAESTSPVLDGLVNDLSRKASTETGATFYNYDDSNGRVYYIDSTGIHIVQIDGYEFLKNDPQKDGTKNKDLDNEKISNDTLEELNNFKKFNSYTAVEKVAKMKDKKSGVYDGLNKNVVNSYSRYLVNNSMLKGLEGTDSSFDVMAEVKSWSQVSSSDSSTYYWTTCLFDYFRTISSSSLTQNKFIDKYISFEVKDDNNSNENVISNTQKWFYNQIETKQSSIANRPGQLFIEADNKWAEEINAKTNASGYPKLILKNKNKDNITNKAASVFWMPKIKQTQTSYGNSLNTKSYNFDYSIIIESIENSYRDLKIGGAK